MSGLTVARVGEQVLIDTTGVIGTFAESCKVDPATRAFSCSADPNFFAYMVPATTTALLYRAIVNARLGAQAVTLVAV